ncbi:MAG: hypothetical protein ACLTY8_02950 [Lachnospiraceae bacterium]
MTALTEIKGFQAFQNAMDHEIREASEGFVRIGYLLKVARDTEILNESGFKSVTEFASSRYGLTADIVSRYIAINDRFSEGGYSDRLAERYQAFGVTKLAEMLTLPDEVIAAVPTTATRQEIREIKAEIAEEMQKTDLEVMMEEPKIKLDTLAQEVMYQYFDKAPERYPQAFTAVYQPDAEEALLETLAPTGIGMTMIRVEGRGKLMLSIEEKDITITNVRTQLRTQYTPEEMVREIRVLCPIDKTPEQAWFALYGRPMEQGEAEPSKPKTVEILTKGKPPKVAPQKAEKMDERPSERERKPEKSERTTTKPEKNTEKRERFPEKPGKIPEKCERMPEKAEDATLEKSEIAPAQEWLERMKECFERALQSAEEGRWVAWEGHMMQAKNVANVMRKAQEDKEIPGQISMDMN